MNEAGVAFTHMPGHLAAGEFPLDMTGLNRYDVVILSDLGANTPLLHPDTRLRGKTMPNRLRLLAEWVAAGGSLIMCGGYYSFAGMYGAAKYYRTVVEEVLPVTIHPFDDRAETPEGVQAEIVPPDHPIVAGLRRRGRHCWASTRSYQAGRHADRHGGRPPAAGGTQLWSRQVAGVDI